MNGSILSRLHAFGFLSLVFLIWTRSPALFAATVTFNGSISNQVIDGFGVNANHRSWNNDELKPVLDAFIDQAGMTLFRVVYDNTDWEVTNDNANASVMNWAYYNSIYGSPEFTKLWSTISYLHGRGVGDGVVLSLMGPGPSWMGGTSLTSGMEEEWAEMVTSLLVYSRSNGVAIRLISPDNEPDISNEGIHIGTATQYTNALHKLAAKLNSNGLSDILFVAPDLAGGGTTYMPQMVGDPVVMSKVAHFGLHSYSDSGGSSSGVYSYLQSTPYPDRTFWVTEFNVWCSTCDSGTRGTYDWSYCKGTADYLLNHLQNNASGGIVWEGYDSFYAHPPSAWSFWGLFSVDDTSAVVKTYTPRKNFYTLAQISKWVRPGARRVGVSGSTSPFSPLLAFKHAASGQVTIVGINTSASSSVLNGTLANLSPVARLDLFYTSATTNLAHPGAVLLTNNSFSASIPADCVFTLTGFRGPTLSLVILQDALLLSQSGGIPQGTYRFECTETLENASWLTLGSSTADDLGFTLFTNTYSPDSPAMFYRSAYP
jgi:O-glycosyl hydrolase